MREKRPVPQTGGRVVPLSAGRERNPAAPRPGAGDPTTPLEGCISLAAVLGATLLSVQRVDRAALTENP